MSEVAMAVGLVGAGMCLAERLAARARAWGPAAVVAVVMALMACGVCGTPLVAGACAVAGAGVWTALAGPCRGRTAAVVDLATMALLTAAVARPGSAGLTGAAGHRPGMRMPGGEGAYDVRFFVFVVACWLVARTGVHVAALAGSGAGPAPARGPAGRGPAAALLHEAGSAAMIVAMAAMVA
ncbi:hypothetical protein AB0399_18075 [Streptomyces sp. NPDC088194]|uniref:hypothetical protein n=1 Tax=Streptomyces sp. NPDC088194 TaxID=3154931 RepID=UPI00344F5D1C